METMARFFDWINRLFGVESGGELLFHPVFIGFFIVAFVYCLIKGWKYSALTVFSFMGGALIFSYLYPEDSSNLGDLLFFLGAMGALALFVVYLGFIRE
ncbi:MAG: hypothetical protein FJ118_00510 [Deltaproteobacteria bacterium]|nr:hypothetical protein [Deltaproteobacteria bacterium]